MAAPTAVRHATFEDLLALEDPDRVEIIDGALVPGWLVKIRPDWVCEIVSPSHEKHDMVDKPKVLHAAEVPHIWLVNPEEKMLLVQRWSPAGYTTVLAASSGQTVRAEPFEEIEIRVGVLFGDPEDDD